MDVASASVLQFLACCFLVIVVVWECGDAVIHIHWTTWYRAQSSASTCLLKQRFQLIGVVIEAEGNGRLSLSCTEKAHKACSLTVT